MKNPNITIKAKMTIKYSKPCNNGILKILFIIVINFLFLNSLMNKRVKVIISNPTIVKNKSKFFLKELYN